MAGNIFSPPSSQQGVSSNVMGGTLFSGLGFLVLLDKDKTKEISTKIYTHGGAVEKKYFKEKVTRIVAESVNLSEERIKRAKASGVIFVKPSWVDASISNNQLELVAQHATEEVSKKQRINPSQDSVPRQERRQEASDNSQTNDQMILSNISTILFRTSNFF
eukprot:TRINITY_DN4425_c0_g1_i1.p1 TRINITY_DN4425_c0_g1~~TRINITY_DN4425_c0_g1_i1.p1  ORF type:complete len:162 (+),score=19.71 TRINITY_DN4425_c0_g1_i1:43-528(+)